MKKDEDRFTIRFNPADPRQKATRDVLSAAGRRKAALITDALCEYMARHGGFGAVDVFSPAPLPATPPIAVVSPYISATTNSDGESFFQISELAAEAEDMVTVRTDISSDSVNTELSDDLRNAVINGLSAFKL